MARDRTTLTILFTDVVGSTELGAERGDEQAQAILGRSAALASEAVGDNGGSVVKSLGDGLLYTFAARELRSQRRSRSRAPTRNGRPRTAPTPSRPNRDPHRRSRRERRRRCMVRP